MKRKESDLLEKLHLPKDITQGAFILTAIGNKELYIENYKGILEYTADCIRIQGKNTSLAMVIRFHGDQHIFDGGQQGDRPEYQRQGADNKLLIDLTDTAVARHDGLHDIQRRSTDIAVNNTDGYQKHADLEPFFLLHLSFASSILILIKTT